MKAKTINVSSSFALFVDRLDNDIIYASLKKDLEDAIIKKQEYSEIGEIPDDQTIEAYTVDKLSETENEEMYSIVDNQAIQVPISRIELKAFKINYDDDNRTRSL